MKKFLKICLFCIFCVLVFIFSFYFSASSGFTKPFYFVKAENVESLEVAFKGDNGYFIPDEVDTKLIIANISEYKLKKANLSVKEAIIENGAIWREYTIKLKNKDIKIYTLPKHCIINDKVYKLETFTEANNNMANLRLKYLNKIIYRKEPEFIAEALKGGKK